MSAHIDLQAAASKMLADLGEDGLVTRNQINTPVRVTVEDGVEQLGEFGQVVARRRVITFLRSEFLPRRGDEVTVRQETVTVETIQSNDGYLVEAVVNG